MLFLISPAKSLDFDTPLEAPGKLPHSLPLFTAEAEPLIKALRKKSWRQIARLMDLSQNLAELNVARYAVWRTGLNADADIDTAKFDIRQAVLAFNGDVYEGLAARTLSAEDLAWAQGHLCILSGLYGVLRPLDLMQPYRLEMGTALKVGRPDNLYQYWGKTIAPYLNQRLVDDAMPTVVNLASQEYFRAVNSKLLHARVVECVFEDFKNGDFKVISFFAKKARGMMARFAIQARVTEVTQLETFEADGYSFAKAQSSAERLVFRRALP